MSKYRLVTLNLDDEAVARINESSNKSAFVRIVIKEFDKRNRELNDMEDLYIRYLSAIRHLTAALADNLNAHWNGDFLADYMDETPLAITQMADAGYLKDAILAAALRHGSP